MKLERSSEISALFDGELEAHEVRNAIKAALNDEECWQVYAVIGDGLRGDCPDMPDLTAGVMARIEEEPVVLAPRNLQARQQHPLLALAASVAGVAVVGWLALTGSPQAPLSGGNFAALPGGVKVAVLPAPTLAKRPEPVAEKLPVQVVPVDLNEYLLAHHAQAETIRLGDSTKQVRTVALGLGRP